MRLQDISETETHQLNSLMGLLIDQARTIFNRNDPNNTLADEVILLLSSLFPLSLVIVFSRYSIKSLCGQQKLLEYIPSWKKYQLLSSILLLSLDEIASNFDAGQYKNVISPPELHRLLYALFMDSNKRKNLLDRIK